MVSRTPIHPRRAVNATAYVVVLECDHIIRIPAELASSVGFALAIHDCDECGPSCDCRPCQKERGA
jgi:hypothetical protein